MKISSKKTEQDKAAPQGDNIEAISPQWWRPILLFSLLAVMMVTTNIFGFSDGLLELQDWIQGQGFLGYVIFVLIHIGAMIAAIPRSVFAVAAGVLFEAIVGIILVTISSFIGVIITFLIARYYAQGAVNRWLLRSERLNKLYNLTEKHGAIIIIITRLLTFSPSNLLNYCFGLTKIHISTYLFWSFLCMFPATIVYVLMADAAAKDVSQVRIPWLSIGAAVMVLIIVFTIVYLLLLKLRRKEEMTG